jgi:hypothetical protein
LRGGLAPFGRIVVRGHFVLLSVVKLWKTLQKALDIVGGLAQEGRVVIVIAEADIALAAQEPAHHAGLVAMVDAGRAAERSFADPASAPLAREHRFEFLNRDSMRLANSFALMLGIVG